MLRFRHVVDRDLVRAPGPLDRQPVYDLGTGPTLGGPHHDHRPQRTRRALFLARGALDLFDLVEDELQQRRHPLVHLHRVIPGDDVRRIAVAFQELAKLALWDSRQQGGVCDLPPIQVQDGKHGAIRDRVEELVRVPACRQWSGLRFAVPDDAEDLQLRVVEGGAVSVRERVSQLAPFMDRSGRLGCVMACDAVGLQKLFRQFSFPGGIPSHDAPETPGSIHEGGELGYALTHAYGAAFDNPELKVFCVIGDGEAETGPLAASWHSNKFLDPITDGAVLPILHLNGWKIANPTLLARIPESELRRLLEGYGYTPHIIAGDDPMDMHQRMAAMLDLVLDEIEEIQGAARKKKRATRPPWPMIVMRTPKGWTGPKEVDGVPVEGTWRAHQVPVDDMTKPEHLRILNEWLRSYRPEWLFDENGTLVPALAALPPTGQRRMSANPHTNGGELTRELRLPEFRDYGVAVDKPGTTFDEATKILGKYLRDVIAHNPRNFRLMGPDETVSNRLSAVFDVTNRAWLAETLPIDDHLAPEGRVMEVLSEHLCQGWLEGYLLTGRHGLFNCYEAFIHIVDSMFNQHAKWLEVTNRISWRRPIPSFNYLLSSHVWRQDHNGFTHQDPGFIDLVLNKKAEVVRVYLAPDTNCLLSIE